MASIDRDKLGEYLSAYLDGELTEQERGALERLVARDPQARAQLDELRQTVELVRGLPRRAAPPSLLEDLTAVGEREQLLGEPSEEVRRRGPWWASARPLLSAAAVVITVSGGLYVYFNINHEGERGDALPETRFAAKPAEPAEPEAKLEDSKRTDGRVLAEASPTFADSFEGGETPAEGLAMAPVDSEGTARLDAAATATDREAAGLGLAVATRAGVNGLAPAATTSELLAVQAARLAEMSTWEQKNSADFRQNALVAHDFDNESNRLIVLVANEDDEQMARSQAANFVVTNQYRDVALMPEESLVSNSARAYMEGRPGYNYDVGPRAEILFRLPVNEVPALVETLANSDFGARPLQLALGRAVAGGRDEIQKLIDGVRRPPGERYALVRERDVLAPAEGEGAYDAGAADEAKPLSGRGRARGVAGVIPAGVSAEEDDKPRPEPAPDHGAAARAMPAKKDIGDKPGSGRGETRSGGAPASPEQPVGVGERLKGTVDRLLTGVRGAEAEEAVKKRAAGAGSPTPTTRRPGELVSNALEELQRKETSRPPSMPPAAAEAKDGASQGVVEQFVTVVVQFQRASAPPAAETATQPAEPEHAGTGDGS